MTDCYANIPLYWLVSYIRCKHTKSSLDNRMVNKGVFISLFFSLIAESQKLQINQISQHSWP